MTTGTDSRNVKAIIQGIMRHNKIDNLKAEMDIFGAWMRYMNEREAGLTPAQSREKITKEYNALGMSEDGNSRNAFKLRMQDALVLDIDEGITSWEAVLDFCYKQDKQGKPIEKFTQWCKEDQYNSPKKHQIAQNPMLIKTVWRSAFAVQSENATVVQVDADGFPESY